MDDVYLAAKRGNTEILKSYLNKANNPDSRDRFGFSLLYLAVTNNNKENSLNTAELLLKYNADPNIQEKGGWSPLMFASRNSNSTSSLDMVKLLLKYKAKVNLKNDDGITALMMASRNSNTTSSLETVKLLLDKRANPNIKESHGVTALMTASINSNSDSSLDTVKLLLDKGADPNIKNEKGDTALTVATLSIDKWSSLDTLKLLLDGGANINIKNNEGKTAAMIAAGKSSNPIFLEALILLFERGADPFEEFSCPSEECLQIVNKEKWARLSKRDRQLSEKYNRDVPISKDIWLLIMRHKRQQQLCSNLGTEKNKELLIYFALELEIPLEEIRNLTKAQLCGIISRQITYMDHNKIQLEKEKDKVKLLEVARRYGIDVTRSLNEILSDLSKIF